MPLARSKIHPLALEILHPIYSTSLLITCPGLVPTMHVLVPPSSWLHRSPTTHPTPSSSVQRYVRCNLEQVWFELQAKDWYRKKFGWTRDGMIGVGWVGEERCRVQSQRGLGWIVSAERHGVGVGRSSDGDDARCLDGRKGQKIGCGFPRRCAGFNHGGKLGPFLAARFPPSRHLAFVPDAEISCLSPNTRHRSSAYLTLASSLSPSCHLPSTEPPATLIFFTHFIPSRLHGLTQPRSSPNPTFPPSYFRHTISRPAAALVPRLPTHVLFTHSLLVTSHR